MLKLSFFWLLLPGCIGGAIVACSQEVPILPSPAGSNSGEPHLSLTHLGQPLLSWLETSPQKSTLLFSILENHQWSSPKIVAEGADWFVNWADFPSVEAFQKDLFVAHWLVKKPGNSYSYDIAISQSSDQGITWSNPQTPHQDGIAAEHGFVTLFHWPESNDRQTQVLWLDGRNPKTGTALRSTLIPPPISEAGSEAGSETAEPEEEIVVDSLVCDCCQTDVAITDQGPVAVYRNRTVKEIRDIYVTRNIDHGWSEPIPVARDNWNIAGCPVNGPAITAKNNQVAVAWYTAAHDTPKVQVAVSTDSGISFQQPILISSDNPLGRVDVTYTTSGELAVIWLQAEGEIATLNMRLLAATGALSPTKVIAKTSAKRPSGFPQIVAANNSLVLAWTDVDEGGQRVLTTLIDQ